MARRTIHRQPFTVSTNANDYTKPQFFTQVEFKGLADTKNDVTIDQNTFVDLKNVYVDDTNLLTSRPPVKFVNNTERGIIYTKNVDGQDIYIERSIVDEHGLFVEDVVEYLQEDGNDTDRLSIGFAVIAKNANNSFWCQYKIEEVGWDYEPKIFCLPLKDKIFFWMDDIAKVLVRTDVNENEFEWEEMSSHLYTPIHELVINGMTSNPESKNFLTDAYIRRYQYSAVSSVDFSKLIGKRIEVSVSDDNGTRKLYDLDNGVTNRGKTLLRPYSTIPGDFQDKVSDIVDVVYTPRSFVILMYDGNTKLMQVTFDGRYYLTLPLLNTIIGKPMLTRDGLYVVAFTQSNIAYCKLVASESDESLDASEVLSWQTMSYPSEGHYFQNITETDGRKYFDLSSEISGDFFDASVVPVGHFETIDNYSYLFHTVYPLFPPTYDHTTGEFTDFRDRQTVLCTHWVRGDGNDVSRINIREDTYLAQGAKLRMYPLTPTSLQPEIGPIVTYLSNDYDDGVGSTSLNLLMFTTENTRSASHQLSPIDIKEDTAIDEITWQYYYDMADVVIYDIYQIGFSVSCNIGICYKNDLYEAVPNTIGFLEVLYNVDGQTISFEGDPPSPFLGDLSEFPNVAGKFDNLTAEKFRFRPHSKDFITSVGCYINENLVTFPNIFDDLTPISLTDDGNLWYKIGEELWTTMLDENVTFFLDEKVNGDTKNVLPEFGAELNEYYFAFKYNHKHLLEVTSTRYNENGDFLLYLPTINEQEFTLPITNLYPLSTTEMGVFTADSIWYIQPITMEDTVYYRQAIRSKIPIGCRYGDDITTAPDGQTILFPAQRGIVAMTPQDFVATTEPILTYLSDIIQDKYYHLYNDRPANVSKLLRDNTDTGYDPMIKICTYRYWMLFYKYMDCEILALDTRSNTWWIWEMPYPIRSIYTNSRLYFVLQVDERPVKCDLTQSAEKEWAVPTYSGKRFVWADRESLVTNNTEGDFPIMNEDTITNLLYRDDVIPNTLSGKYEFIYENEFFGNRLVVDYASPVINWHITSQRLHFGQIVNYKTIKNIMMNARGTDTITARLSTKVYRDFYHPEQSEVTEIKINDLRTFVKHLNLMHTINFQYKLENNKMADVQHQLKLNSIGIKYEVKERIR